MAARGSKGTQQARTQAERARLHAARKTWHGAVMRRRVRDNAIVIVAGSVLVIAAIASQVVHAQVTAPEPTPTPTVTGTSTPTPTATPSATPSATPTPTESPAK